MLIRSTGLGSTLLSAKVANLESTDIVPETIKSSENGEEPTRMLMTLETVAPVNWTMRIFVEPSDLRRMLWLVLLHPSLLFSSFGLLFRNGNKTETNLKLSTGELNR